MVTPCIVGTIRSDPEMAAVAKREVTPTSPGWVDAPDAVPRAAESVAVSIRLPKKLLGILREFARREGIGYQVLMKRWLDERIGKERYPWSA